MNRISLEGRSVIVAICVGQLGVALDATGGPQNESAWMAAFAVLAAGILLGPLALLWSRRETVQ
ncbi:hypothetical protein [Bradyrhizobium retamae]|uniref:Uncharacterized protein n=1 Tax=Bradyrhizobium retamae TaxID=1300035 RepID=A0A0R3MPG9_9BRAD|nr:hypothetical protein [Bradyrhizobium retamae]KRR21825.1 hypothetical protein CQ13_07250 [Bradyrhizobium retamae]